MLNEFLIFKGKVVATYSEGGMCAKGLDLYSYTHSCKTLKYEFTLPCNKLYKPLYRFSLFRRLFRKGVHHLVKTECDEVIFYDKKAYSRKLDKAIDLDGGRPLCVCADQNGNVFYGTYHSNVNRTNSSYVYRISGEHFEQEQYCSFNNVRHIHGVFHDSFTSKIWVTTGDVGEENGLWIIDDKEHYHLFIGGSQKERAVSLEFTETAIYYGTDTPLEQNYLFKVDRCTKERTVLTDVSSSIFYSCSNGENFFFSTAIEPSEYNKTQMVEVWQVNYKSESVRLLTKYKKDYLPMKYFQYGQVQFPFSIEETQFLTMYLSGVIGDGKSFLYRLKNI